ncbi:MAG: hypothetical protein U5K54_22515 [Cytophagales bacterium]|nr:hypothetical protein [Cytophagales bacterium]
MQNGGVLIGFERALNFFSGAGLGKFEVKKEDDLPAGQAEKKDPSKPKPYADIDENQRAQATSGANL